MYPHYENCSCSLGPSHNFLKCVHCLSIVRISILNMTWIFKTVQNYCVTNMAVFFYCLWLFPYLRDPLLSRQRQSVIYMSETFVNVRSYIVPKWLKTREHIERTLPPMHVIIRKWKNTDFYLYPDSDPGPGFTKGLKS